MLIQRHKREQGFTIVELMIALSILSTILVIATVLMIRIGALYTKGVNQANLQNSARNITNDVATAIQYSGSSVVPCSGATCGNPYDAFCINQVRYSYTLNRELGTDNADNPVTHTSAGTNTPHVLWRDSQPSGGSCQPANLSLNKPSASGYEMVPNHDRLTRLDVTETPANSGIYLIHVWMAYGDSDLVNVDTAAGPNQGHPTCDGGAGTQYCALSVLTTSVLRRVGR